MKTYKASQELIDILLKFGFKDETKQYFPEHYKSFKQKEYDPHGMKRKFTAGSYKDYIIFDYINIKLANGQDRYSLTEG